MEGTLEACGAQVSFARVTRRFGTVTAVDDVSLALRAGEFFTLLGPSGSGKTTLLHMLAGFLQPDAGQILVDGRVVSGQPAFKRDIGVVFQNYALFPNMTVFENVAFPLRVRGVARDGVATRVREALSMVELSDFDERRTHELSGGQQQRVALARAFVFEPRLLLMDEPLSALDAKLRRAMRLEVKGLQQKLGVTVLYVTHDQEEALALSDRIAVMNRGAIEQVDAPGALYERPGSRFVADFLGEANLIETTLVGESNGGIREATAGAHRFRFHLDRDARPGTNVWLGVRPERVVLAPSATMANRAQGTVKSVVYGGDHTIVRVDIGSSMIVVKRPPTGHPLDIGAHVIIGWDTAHGVALLR